jgi:hypothetical protein
MHSMSFLLIVEASSSAKNKTPGGELASSISMRATFGPRYLPLPYVRPQSEADHSVSDQKKSCF